MESEKTPAELSFGGSWKMIIPFALLPLVIVSAAVGIFFLFGKLADNQLTGAHYLEKLESGSARDRWQAAYELSGFLSRQDVGGDREKYEDTLLRLLTNTRSDESDLRRYLLIALGQVGGEKSVPTLTALASTNSDAETRIYSLWALGRMGQPEARPVIVAALGSEDAGIRKTAAYALGLLGDREDIAALTHLLDDPIKDVRWNAALALAHLGSTAGKNEILLLLDPARLLEETPNLRESERSQITLSAVNAAGQLSLAESKSALDQIASSAQDPVLRNAARQVLQTLTKSNGSG